MEDNSYKAVIAVVNQGFAQVVMEAARDAGCRGGTIIHARGTGHLGAQKKYGIAVTPEKEFIIMLVANEFVDPVIKAVDKAVGLNTDGHGVVFSIPAEHISGIKIK